MPRTITQSDVESACVQLTLLGEGPSWDERNGTLWWVDIDAHRLWSLRGRDGAPRHWDLEQEVTAAIPRRGGGLVLGLRHSIALTDTQVQIVATLPVVSPERDVRLNDAACDAAGRLWIGSMATDDRHGRGALFCVNRDHTIWPALTRVTISNGLGWSPDGKTMYHIDTNARRVDMYPYDVTRAALGRRGTLTRLAPSLGRPDGLAVDVDGCVWVALWGGASVHRYTPNGKLDARVELPVSNVTSCCFGGPRLDELYITTARRGLDPQALAAQPLAGALFVCRPGPQGLRAHPFAG
jgi:sugar lactone lactonase YvrE